MIITPVFVFYAIRIMAYLEDPLDGFLPDVVEFDIDPTMVEDFVREATPKIKERFEAGERFALVAAPEARPYVRMIIERLFPTLPVLSHVEIAKGVEIRVLGSIS